MKKKTSKKWIYWLLAIFVMILTMGCSADSQNGTVVGNTVEEANQPPVITVQNQEVEYGTTLTYSDIASVTDDDSESIVLSVKNSDLNGITVDDANQTIVLNAVGDFEIGLSASDEEGNVTTEIVTIKVVDKTAPTLTFTSTAFSLTAGDSAPNYASVAKATDNVDGDITSFIKVDSSKVKLNSAGTYEVTYSVTDSSGNTTTQTATVTVIAKATSSNSSTTYVLITKTGDCYHTHKCGNGTYYEVTLEEALRRGLRKCKKCY